MLIENIQYRALQEFSCKNQQSLHGIFQITSVHYIIPLERFWLLHQSGYARAHGVARTTAAIHDTLAGDMVSC